MTIGRREFMLAGGAVAGAGVLPVAATMAAPVTGGRSVTDFGVEPNKDGDQEAALQNAIAEISRSGNAVYIPAGSYRVSDWVELPPICSIIGDPGLTRLSPTRIGGWVFAATENQTLYLSGLTLDGRAAKGARMDLVTYLAMIKGGVINIVNCHFANVPGAAISAENVGGVITTSRFIDCDSGALHMLKARGLTISQSIFERCNVPSGPGGGCIGIEGEGVTISSNNIFMCTAGIALRGSGVVNGNYIFAREYGLRLGGSGQESAAIIATGNNITGCDIGIMVSAGGETIFASINLITGPKSAAIRAFDGDKLVGPDLARESAESYLNLTVAGNVVR